MKVNISIENTDILPVPYIGKCGENVKALNLFKDKPILMDALCITSTSTSQLLVHGEKNDVIIPLSTAVTINFV